MRSPGPYKVEKTKGGGFALTAPGTVITAGTSQRTEVGLEVLAAQLNRAHEAGRLEGRKELDDAEAKLSDKHRVQRDGWRLIAEALIAIGLDFPMRGFGEDPPREILDGLITPQIREDLEIKDSEIDNSTRTERQRADDERVLASIRDALFGRAWRCAGPDGRGMCDYPLCPNRIAVMASAYKDEQGVKRYRKPFSLIAVQIADDCSLNVCNANEIERDSAQPGRKRTEMLRECEAWAKWIAQRARAGRIEIRR